MTLQATSTASPTLLERIARRAHAQMVAMIHFANTRPDERHGDPKVGGHPASCASSLHILAALHLHAREPFDYVCCKPHAAPMDHCFHLLMDLFREEGTTNWFDEERSKAAMYRLRKFAAPGEEDVFQSYHARSDPDSWHFLPSGSVGIPPVVSVYLALAHRYARDHGLEVPPKAHFWSLIGDSEFREGSLLEALPDVAERQLGNVTWIIDYNRQNLDGTRIPNERGLESSDCDRIERTALANGWRVIQVRHGRFRDELFARPGGDTFRDLLENGLSDYELQMLLFDGTAQEIREFCRVKHPTSERFLAGLMDNELCCGFSDLGGHCMEALMSAFDRSRTEPNEPYMVIAHTLKGFGLECQANPANHSILPGAKEVEALLAACGLSLDDPFARFEPGSEEAEWLAVRRDMFRQGIEENMVLRQRNRTRVRNAVAEGGGIPDSLEIDQKLFPIAHTQWMWGQLASKLVRIGTRDGEDPSGTPKKALTDNEKRWKASAEFLLTLSPDVGTSTNISPTMNRRVYGPDAEEEFEHALEVSHKHPNIDTSDDSWTRHIRFEIAEANCMSAVAAFGKMAHYTGLPFIPVMTVYDFFIKRALDQLYYNLYWGAEFILMGTPSGVTLSSEGAQHSWKSDIQIPNLITWEPMFAIEMDWILSDAIQRKMQDRNKGRCGVLIRGVTRGVQQSLLLDNLKRQVRYKSGTPGAPLKPSGASAAWGAGAIDEGTLTPLPDAEIFASLRADVLEGAYHLVDWTGYAGYEPGDNVVNVFVMGSLGPEALSAAQQLSERGIFANVIVITSPELLLGILGEKSDYRHLLDGLGVTGDLFAVPSALAAEAEVLSIAGRRVPCIAVCDGEAGLVDNIGSVIGVKQRTLAVRKFSKCGRPDEIFGYQGLDAASIVEACGRVLSETALEELRVSKTTLERIGGHTPAVRDWRELWPDAPRG